MLRHCARHGWVHFALYGSGAGRNERWSCTRCVGERVTRRHQEIKALLVGENGGCCAICGYAATPYNLHFHHVDPSSKSFSVNMARGKSLASFRAEAAKCVLVCANCHGEIEAGLIASPPAGAKYGEPWDPLPATPTTTDSVAETDVANEQLPLFDAGSGREIGPASFVGCSGSPLPPSSCSRPSVSRTPK